VEDDVDALQGAAHRVALAHVTVHKLDVARHIARKQPSSCTGGASESNTRTL